MAVEADIDRLWEWVCEMQVESREMYVSRLSRGFALRRRISDENPVSVMSQ